MLNIHHSGQTAPSLEEKLGIAAHKHGIVGNYLAMQHVLANIEAVASTDPYGKLETI